MKELKLLLGTALLCLSVIAHGQVLRAFPPDAPRGYLKFDVSSGSLVLNKKPIKSTPGLQIRDRSNRIIFPRMIDKEYVVKYKLEGTSLHRVWILTPYEIAQPDKHKLPTQALPEVDGSLEPDEDDDKPAPPPPKDK